MPDDPLALDVVATSLAHAWLLQTFFAGCGDTPAGDLHPLTGIVTRRGKPVSRGGLIFAPTEGAGGSWITDASVGADGTFSARTSRLGESPAAFRPGLRAGTYRVTYHPPGDGSRMGLDVDLPDLLTVAAGGGRVELTLPDGMPEGRGAPRDEVRAATPE